ncbi:hypothetical protein C1645_840742 [Glomus cerebriforme]|uniref:Uncharacterized protein n=1 Tax=Glomus cerebriforme TaxID=658196 RepID=A0A397SAQ7_9GLOM|nr:hypothetical protein C1645_840742 [Glomus cerebriforme]
MSDVQIWKYVLKWGFAQNLELSSNSTSFSKDDNTLAINAITAHSILMSINNMAIM